MAIIDLSNGQKLDLFGTSDQNRTDVKGAEWIQVTLSNGVSFDPRVDVLDLRGRNLSGINWFRELGGQTLTLRGSADFRGSDMDNLPVGLTVPNHLEVSGLALLRVIEGARIGGNLFANDSGLAVVADTSVVRNFHVRRARDRGDVVAFLSKVYVGGLIYGEGSTLSVPQHLEGKVVGADRPQYRPERVHDHPNIA